MGDHQKELRMKDQNTAVAETPGTEVVKKPVGHVQKLRDLMRTPGMMAEMKTVMQKGMDPDRILRVALTAYQRNDQLWDCEAASICSCIIEASGLGLEVNGVTAEAYIVPFNNKNTHTKQGQLMLGYKGLSAMALRSPRVVSIYPPEVVYEKDTYSVEKGMNPKLEHKPYIGTDDRGKIIAAYCIAKIKDQDEKAFVWLALEDIEALRNRSKAKNSGPWVTDRAAMCRKSAVRQLCKYLPLEAWGSEAIDKQELREFNVMEGEEFVPTPAPASNIAQSLDDVAADLEGKETPPVADQTGGEFGQRPDENDAPPDPETGEVEPDDGREEAVDPEPETDPEAKEDPPEDHEPAPTQEATEPPETPPEEEDEPSQEEYEDAMDKAEETGAENAEQGQAEIVETAQEHSEVPPHEPKLNRTTEPPAPARKKASGAPIKRTTAAAKKGPRK